MSSSIIPAVLSELQSQYGITYEDAIQLQDENGNTKSFFIATHYGARVLVDMRGQLWMNEAELSHVLEVDRRAVNNTIVRLRDSKIGRAFTVVHKLWTTDQRGHKRLMAFYNEKTVDIIISRQQEPTDQALEFAQEREMMITGIREYLHNYSLNTIEQNFQLAAKLEDANAALQNQRFLTYEIDDLKQEINNRWLDDLQERYPEEDI